jgi:uncharacterized protein DUF2867
MKPLPPQEFLAQPLRAHTFLSGVPLHDVWAVDLPLAREGITLQEFLQRTRKTDMLRSVSWPVRALFALRVWLGRIFGWDKEPKRAGPSTFVERLTDEDRRRSGVPPGTSVGFFHVVYSFENEVLREAINRTVHAATLFALLRTPRGYRFYFAVYVRRVSWITPIYMALIGPFRRWIVYPAILRQIQRSWSTAFGLDESRGTSD